MTEENRRKITETSDPQDKQTVRNLAHLISKLEPAALKKALIHETIHHINDTDEQIDYTLVAVRNSPEAPVKDLLLSLFGTLKQLPISERDLFAQKLMSELHAEQRHDYDEVLHHHESL